MTECVQMALIRFLKGERTVVFILNKVIMKLKWVLLQSFTYFRDTQFWLKLRSTPPPRASGGDFERLEVPSPKRCWRPDCGLKKMGKIHGHGCKCVSSNSVSCSHSTRIRSVLFLPSSGIFISNSSLGLTTPSFCTLMLQKMFMVHLENQESYFQSQYFTNIMATGSVKACTT